MHIHMWINFISRYHGFGSDDNKLFSLKHMLLSEQQVGDDILNTLKKCKLTLLSKKELDRAFHGVHNSFPAIEYTTDTAFIYNVSIYTIPNLYDLLEGEDIHFHSAYCGKTLIEGAESEKKRFIYDMAMNAYLNLRPLRSYSIINPLVGRMYGNTEFSTFKDFKSQMEAWEKETQPLLAGPARTYMDMVCFKPGGTTHSHVNT